MLKIKFFNWPVNGEAAENERQGSQVYVYVYS